MAHGNYDCCAICDCELDYSDAEAKEVFCPNCKAILRRYGINIKNNWDIDTFMKWVNGTDVETVKKVLIEMSFRVCYYNNAVDEVVLGKFGIKNTLSVRGKLLKDIIMEYYNCGGR